MKQYFADAGYYIALINPRDQLHKKAVQLASKLRPFTTVTTDLVLNETLTYFSKRGSEFRELAYALVQNEISSPAVEVVYCGRLYFLEGLRLYGERTDQKHSLTDCVSIVVIQDKGLGEALAYDQHFLSEGLIPLLRDATDP